MKCVYRWVGVRAGVRYVITKFSQMDSLPNFVTHGASRARELLYNNTKHSTIKMTPVEAGKKKNESTVYFSLYGDMEQ